MSQSTNPAITFVKKLVTDFLRVSKRQILRIFAGLGLIFGADKILDNPFIKRRLERIDVGSAVNLSETELLILSLFLVVFYVLDSFLKAVSANNFRYAKEKKIIINKYSQKEKAGFRKARIGLWVIYLPFLIWVAVSFIGNNDFCQSQGGTIGIKIFQFSTDYERGGEEDGVTAYVYNHLQQKIPSDSVEITKSFNHIDFGTKTKELNKHLSCYNKGILVYGFKNHGDSTFICDILLRNMKNTSNRIQGPYGIIVLDDPEFISFTEGNKGKYLSEFILGLFYYYDKQYLKAIATFNPINQNKSAKQISAYSNRFTAYAKLRLGDTSGYNNLKLADRLDPSITDIAQHKQSLSNCDSVRKKNLSKNVLIKTAGLNIEKKGWPAVVISASKLNVLYIGVPNPIEILVNGYDSRQIEVAIDNGIITGKNGKYTVTVSNAGKANIHILQKLYNGKTKQISQAEFRINRIPDAKPTFAGISGGNTSVANLQAQDRLFVTLPNFDFDVKFTITHFTMLVAAPRKDALIYTGHGNQLTPAMKNGLLLLKPGSTIIFKDLIAVGPDHSPRSLDPIVISAN